MYKGKTEYEKGHVQGLKDAAEFINSFNKVTLHPYLLGDCILCKFNITDRKRPRKNKVNNANKT